MLALPGAPSQRTRAVPTGPSRSASRRACQHTHTSHHSMRAVQKVLELMGDLSLFCSMKNNHPWEDTKQDSRVAWNHLPASGIRVCAEGHLWLAYPRPQGSCQMTGSEENELTPLTALLELLRQGWAGGSYRQPHFPLRPLTIHQDIQTQACPLGTPCAHPGTTQGAATLRDMPPSLWI